MSALSGTRDAPFEIGSCRAFYEESAYQKKIVIRERGVSPPSNIIIGPNHIKTIKKGAHLASFAVHTSAQVLLPTSNFQNWLNG